MKQYEMHFNPPGSPREIGCSATSGPWTTALANVTCAVCQLLYGPEAAPLVERRQRAREAAYDAVPPIDNGPDMRAVEAAIETATRVRVRGEVYEAGFQAYDASGLTHSGAIMETITAAFRAAGFEVEE